MAGIGPIRQDWEPVVVRKKAPTAAAKKDEKAVNAARRSGAEIETMKKCAYYCLPHLLLPFSFDLIRFAFPSPFLWIEGVLFFLGAIFLLDLIDPCRSGAEGIDRFGLGSSFLFSVDFFLGYRFLGLLLMDSFWEKRFRFFFGRSWCLILRVLFDLYVVQRSFFYSGLRLNIDSFCLIYAQITLEQTRRRPVAHPSTPSGWMTTPRALPVSHLQARIILFVNY